MVHWVGRYAWLLGDGALLVWAIFELVQLRAKPADPPDREDDRPSS
jgi:hypothetical protein